MISYAACTDPFILYFKTIGLHLFSDINAPYLNFSKAEPLVVPPSGNTNNGAYFPVVSIKFYLSIIVSIAFYLFSEEPPLGK